MHAGFKVGETELPASDGDCKGRAESQGFSLTLQVESKAEAEKAFAALADGGKVRMPLSQTSFAKRFGQLTNQFGMSWMIMLASKYSRLQHSLEVL